MVNEGRLSISQCFEEMAPLWRDPPVALPGGEFDPGQVRVEMDLLAQEAGLSDAEVGYLTEYFMVVERLNLPTAYQLFFNFDPLTVSAARAERREILSVIAQAREEVGSPGAGGGPERKTEDEWPYLTVAAAEGAGYAMSLRPEDRGALFEYEKSLFPVARFASLEECVHQLWRGVVLGEVTTTGEFVDHTPDYDIWTTPD